MGVWALGDVLREEFGVELGGAGCIGCLKRVSEVGFVSNEERVGIGGSKCVKVAAKV